MLYDRPNLDMTLNGQLMGRHTVSRLCSKIGENERK
mgnify:FL=1